MNTSLLEPFAIEHHGLVTAAAARRSGISSSAWYRAIDRGEIEQLHPGVARLPGTPRTKIQAIAAAVLAAGRGAMASHRSAARLFGIPRPDDDPIDVILTERRREAALDGVVTHRPRDHKDIAPVIRQGIRCTTVVRCLCDLGAVDECAVHGAVGHVLAARLATLNELENVAAVHARPGRHGIPALRAALADWAIDAKPADSVLELAMRDLRVRFRLPAMEFHAVVEGYEVDFLIVGTNIVLECDGWESHGLNRGRFEFDRFRRADLTGAGYVVVEFTYRQITAQPAVVAKRIKGVVATWAPEIAC